MLLGFGAPLPAGVSLGFEARQDHNDIITDGGIVSVGLAQVGVGVTGHIHDETSHPLEDENGDVSSTRTSGSIVNAVWQWQRSATEHGAYRDIPCSAEGGTSNPYIPSAGDLGMWLKAKVTYDLTYDPDDRDDDAEDDPDNDITVTGRTAQAITQQPVSSKTGGIQRGLRSQLS